MILFIIPFGESSGKGIEKERKRKENIIKFVWIRRCRRAMNPTTFQTVEAAKRKIQEKRRAGVQGQNPQPQKKAKKKKKDGQKSAASLPVYAPYYLDALIRAREGGGSGRPITKIKIDSKEKEKKKKKPDGFFYPRRRERQKTGHFFQLDTNNNTRAREWSFLIRPTSDESVSKAFGIYRGRSRQQYE